MNNRVHLRQSEARFETHESPSAAPATLPPFSFSTTTVTHAETDCDFVDRRRRVTAHLKGVRYYGLRYYNPELGRWINRDPIGEAVSRNLNASCGNNFLNHYDMLGLIKVMPGFVAKKVAKMIVKGFKWLGKKSAWNDLKVYRDSRVSCSKGKPYKVYHKELKVSTVLHLYAAVMSKKKKGDYWSVVKDIPDSERAQSYTITRKWQCCCDGVTKWEKTDIDKRRQEGNKYLHWRESNADHMAQATITLQRVFKGYVKERNCVNPGVEK